MKAATCPACKAIWPPEQGDCRLCQVVRSLSLSHRYWGYLSLALRREDQVTAVFDAYAADNLGAVAVACRSAIRQIESDYIKKLGAKAVHAARRRSCEACSNVADLEAAHLTPISIFKRRLPADVDAVALAFAPDNLLLLCKLCHGALDGRFVSADRESGTVEVRQRIQTVRQLARERREARSWVDPADLAHREGTDADT